jgi:hypothetical protein
MPKSELKGMFVHNALTEEQVNLLKEFGSRVLKSEIEEEQIVEVAQQHG